MFIIVQIVFHSDGQYPYIRHTDTTAGVVPNEIKINMLSHFGLLKTIHSSNGSEFVNDIIAALVLLWPGKVRFINGAPGHSQEYGAPKRF